MLTGNCSGHAWRPHLCQALESGHDYNETEVRQLFDEARVWAKEQMIRFDPKTDHAAAYLESRDNGEPVIPDFLRRYCAHSLGILHVAFGTGFTPQAAVAA